MYMHIQYPQDDRAIVIPPKLLMLPMYVDNIVHSQVAISPLTPCTKSHKFNPNVENALSFSGIGGQWEACRLLTNP